MNSKLIESIANAVLYEGYMLYPYRPSAVKNRQRWNFGVLYPRAYSEAQSGNDRWFMQTECLISGAASAAVDVKARFLQAVPRQTGRPSSPRHGEEDRAPEVESTNKDMQSWQEAVECSVPVESTRLADLIDVPLRQDFEFPAARGLDPVTNDGSSASSSVVRTREAVRGSIEISAVSVATSLFKLTVLLSNLTRAERADIQSRDLALLKSLLSAHMILSVSEGNFSSLIDPPAELQTIVGTCNNQGTWPVLVGESGSTDAMLSSPIILYDYPQIAPESAGDLFDGTEIDEILALRILTLSDEEKREIRQSGARAREVLERTEMMPTEQFLKLHGVLRGMKLTDISKVDRKDHG
jgi:hypothetical protein